mmetsp:Transcript_11498/g.35113  ORF Transcript_11498/g.35113 Transcript_11498/m.35113 type:complete len:292 (-) Transcript_11498:212-1087(-)
MRWPRNVVSTTHLRGAATRAGHRRPASLMHQRRRSSRLPAAYTSCSVASALPVSLRSSDSSDLDSVTIAAAVEATKVATVLGIMELLRTSRRPAMCSFGGVGPPRMSCSLRRMKMLQRSEEHEGLHCSPDACVSWTTSLRRLSMSSRASTPFWNPVLRNVPMPPLMGTLDDARKCSLRSLPTCSLSARWCGPRTCSTMASATASRTTSYSETKSPPAALRPSFSLGTNVSNRNSRSVSIRTRCIRPLSATVPSASSRIVSSVVSPRMPERSSEYASDATNSCFKRASAHAS